PRGSRILLVAGGNTRDYPLFAPSAGFANTVVPWGNHPFDPDRAAALLSDNHITHVVIEHDQAVGFHWAGGIRTEPVVSWMQHRNDFREAPLATPHMRLFV